MADYLRATRAFAARRITGYVAEQSARALGYEMAPLPRMSNSRIVQGRHFIIHDPAQAIGY